LGRLELRGRVALVTGAARGIGLATAQELHARGASVALVGLDAHATAQAAHDVGERTLGVGADVTDPAAVEEVVGRAVESFGGLDVCVANAGVAPRAATVLAMDAGAFERVIEVNLLGAYRTARAAVPHVIARGGHVSVVASIYVFLTAC
jgi:NAD(P)-dependent dehydrogenase (short-subunit alcohol dehydrogenase family)